MYNTNDFTLTRTPILQAFRFQGTVFGFRFPIKFSGSNDFLSNMGGGINVNHASVTISGKTEFSNNIGTSFGGALRIGELSLVSHC